MTIKKTDLADNIWNTLRGDVSRAQAASYLAAVLNEVKQAMVAGEKLKISGFGSFETRRKVDREGRNPKTGEPITIKGRRVVMFKLSQVLKGEMNR